MKGQVNKGAAAIIIAVAAILLGWFGWRTLYSPGTIQIDKEGTYQEVEKRAKANGVDLRTIPQWAGEYYKHHPEEKPSASVAANAPASAASLPPGAPLGNNGAPMRPPAIR